eukprot:TRINITY_DN25104_c0_g1_i1.p1 TRINITY_DN25104_c0_g1~~TRINITY_DN25104_c0_g1_i1.p1  ORF type:complete len:546 (-),score=71.37 TRINITY_DN25104_c0_g1_i1:32-1669(-)
MGGKGSKLKPTQTNSIGVETSSTTSSDFLNEEKHLLEGKYDSALKTIESLTAAKGSLEILVDTLRSHVQRLTKTNEEFLTSKTQKNSEIESLNEELKRIQILYNTLQEAESKSKNSVDDSSIDHHSSTNNPSILVPSESQFESLITWLIGDRSVTEDDVWSAFRDVEKRVIFEWFLWTSLHCKRLAKLLTLSKMATAHVLLSLPVMMARITDEACIHLQAEQATVFVWDEEEKQLYSLSSIQEDNSTRPVTSCAFREDDNGSDEPVSIRQSDSVTIDDDDGIAGFVFQSGETVSIVEVTQDLRYSEGADCRQGVMPFTMCCCRINAHGGKRLGVLQVINKKQSDEFSEQDKIRLESLAVKAGVQLYRSQALDEAKNVIRNNPLLDQLMSVDRRELSLNRTIQETREKVSDILECQRASVFLADTSTKELFTRTVEGYEIRFPWNKGLAGECYSKREVIIVNDPYSDSRFNQAFDRKHNFKTRSIMCLPIYDENTRCVGVIQAINKGVDEEDEFEEEDEHYFRQTVTQAGADLQYARLFERAARWT